MYQMPPSCSMLPSLPISLSLPFPFVPFSLSPLFSFHASASLSHYRHIFVAEYNLDFHMPKADRCALCEEFQVMQLNKIANGETADQKHTAEKTSMRLERNDDGLNEAGCNVLRRLGKASATRSRNVVYSDWFTRIVYHPFA